MDLESLRAEANEIVSYNLELHDKELEQERKKRETAKDLVEAIGKREEIYRGIASLAINPVGNNAYESSPLLVGTLAVTIRSGSADSIVTRNLRAVVRNGYERIIEPADFDLDLPDAINVRYALEAEEGDVAKGLFDSISCIGNDTDGKVFLGQFISTERFRANAINLICEDGKTFTNSNVELTHSGNQSIEGSRIQIATIEAQIPILDQTLGLLRAAKSPTVSQLN